MIRELARSPNFWDEATTRHNVLFRYAADQINGTAFDPESIMLYFFPAEWTTNGVGDEGQRGAVEAGQAVHRRREDVPEEGAHGGQRHAAGRSVRRQRTAASIGKFGEEDLFRFTCGARGPLHHRHARARPTW